MVVYFFKQKTAYELRSSDWSSDVCSSDLAPMRRILDISINPSSLGKRRFFGICRSHMLQCFGHRIAPENPGITVDRETVGHARDIIADMADGRAFVAVGQPRGPIRPEERRLGKSVSVRVDLGGRRTNKKKIKTTHKTR